jgi:hypothetical protein
MKEIVCITSHANTTEKLDLLYRCIKTMKSQNFDIILSSHITVPTAYVDMVDYFIYDKENALINWNEYNQIGGGMSYWMDYPKFFLSKNLDFNHGYAVLRMYKNSAHLAKANNYDIIHFMDYDYISSDENVLKSHSLKINSGFDAYLYRLSEDWVNSGFFSFNVDKFIQSVDAVVSKETYCRIASILENVLFKLYTSNSIHFYLDDNEELKKRIEVDLMNQTSLYGLYKFDTSDIRLIVCKDHLNHYIFTFASQYDEQNKLILKFNSQTHFFDMASGETFFEIPQELITQGFEINFSKNKINLQINGNSNISYCEIRDPSIIKKITI